MPGVTAQTTTSCHRAEQPNKAVQQMSASAAADTSCCLREASVSATTCIVMQHQPWWVLQVEQPEATQTGWPWVRHPWEPRLAWKLARQWVPAVRSHRIELFLAAGAHASMRQVRALCMLDTL